MIGDQSHFSPQLTKKYGYRLHRSIEVYPDITVIYFSGLHSYPVKELLK